MSASGSGRGRKRKNTAGYRSDPGWEHGIEVDAASKKVKCKYCNVTGIYRLKHDLACTHQNVEPCPQVPEDVREKFMSLLRTQTLESQNKKKRMLDIGDDDFDDEVELLHAGGHENKHKHYGGMDKFVVNKSRHQNQKTINQLFKKEERDDVCQTIARFFYTSAIPFNCVKNPIFPLMVKKIGDYGKGLVPPSYHEIRVTFLKKEVQETLQLLDEFKEQWKKTGCTIMSDGWSDGKRRSICNFLVNSPNGTIFLSSLDTSDISKTGEKVFEMLDEVVDKVGVEHVVQLVTDNASNYKLAGEMLMEKRKTLFWTPCAAHCIDLMLEDFEKQIQLHRVTIKKGKRIVAYIYSRTNLIHWMKEFTKGIELIRPAVTRFATSYLTLRRLHEQKGALFSLFTSSKWRNSRFARSEKGKKIEDIVLDNRIFWKGVSMCLKVAVPLIKVLRLVDSDEHPAMGFIYEAMDRAKEEIQSNFNNAFACYDPIWTIIDRRWESQLHHPLHAAAYFLNPQFHYSPNFQPDAEVKIGLYKCLERMVPDVNERVKIDLQIDAFKSARGLFGIQNAIMTRKKKSPADWWDSFGDECPELKRFAIRILSLTCSSSGCERNWSAFEMVHSKRRNRLHQKRMNDLVFVMYNLKLRQRHTNRQAIVNPLCLDDVPSDDEWITERETPTLPREGNWLSVLDRNARHGCGSDEDEVEALSRNLEEACRDHVGREHDEVHEVSDDDAMDQNMDARRDFDHDFEDATIGEDIEDLDGTGGGDDDDDDDDVAMINADCDNNDDNFGDNDDLL